MCVLHEYDFLKTNYYKRIIDLPSSSSRALSVVLTAPSVDAAVSALFDAFHYILFLILLPKFLLKVSLSIRVNRGVYKDLMFMKTL